MKDLNKAQSAFEKALEIDRNNAEAMEGFKKCILTSSSNPEDVRKRAMADPEVQQILIGSGDETYLRTDANRPQSSSGVSHELLSNILNELII